MLVVSRLYYWSARSSSDCGIVRPSALAVLRLMTSSNLVGCLTGAAPVFVPSRIYVLFLDAEWSHEEFVDAQGHLEQRRAHAGEEARSVSRVGCPGGKDASSLRQRSVHALVDRVDPRHHCQRLRARFETEPQHRVEGAVKTPHPAPALGATSTVVGHTASHER